MLFYLQVSLTDNIILKLERQSNVVWAETPRMSTVLHSKPPPERGHWTQSDERTQFALWLTQQLRCTMRSRIDCRCTTYKHCTYCCVFFIDHVMSSMVFMCHQSRWKHVQSINGRRENASGGTVTSSGVRRIDVGDDLVKPYYLPGSLVRDILRYMRRKCYFRALLPVVGIGGFDVFIRSKDYDNYKLTRTFNICLMSAISEI